MCKNLLWILYLQLKGASAEAEQGRMELEDRLAEMMNKLREAWAQAEATVSVHVTAYA